MTLMEEKTLADHDINVRSIRQELQLLEEQLKKHGRNEPSQSPTVQPDPDTVSRQAEPQIIHCKDCKSLLKWRSEEAAKEWGQSYECAQGVLLAPHPDDYCSHAKRKNGGCGMSDNTEFSDGFSAGYVAGYRAGKDRYKTKWIPVTERLPEYSCQTLVTTKWDTEYSVEYGFYWGENNKWGVVNNNVIAWMPLPEPYKGTDHDR